MTTFIADGSSAIYQCHGSFNIAGEGDFGSGTLNLQYENADGWANMVGASYTSDFNDVIENHGLMRVKFVLSSSTSPDLNYVINGNGTRQVAS